MLSLRTSMSMSSNISIISLLLFCFSEVLSLLQNPITNIRVLDSYFNGASKFLQNRPFFDGITLVLPKQQLQSPLLPLNHPLQSAPIQSGLLPPGSLQSAPQRLPFPTVGNLPNRHNPVLANFLHNPLFGHKPSHHGGYRHPSLHPQEPHLDAVSLSQSPVPRPYRLVMNGKTQFQPLFQPYIKSRPKYRKPKKNRIRPKLREPKIRSEYPKSINDRLREKDKDDHNHEHQHHEGPEDDDDGEHYHRDRDRDRDRDRHHHHDHDHDHEDDHNHGHKNENEENEDGDHFDDPYYKELQNPKSYYNNLPPFGKQSKTQSDNQKHLLSFNRIKDINSFANHSNKSRKLLSKHSERSPLEDPQIESDFYATSGPNIPNIPGDSNSRFENTPPFSPQNQLNFVKPLVQSRDYDNKDLSDKQNMGSNHHWNQQNQEKYRTATANQLSSKDQNEKKQFNQNNQNNQNNQDNQDNHDKDVAVATVKSLPKEDLDSNDDPNYYPHQYAIEIRWKNNNKELFDLDAPEGNVGDREMHSSKDLDHARHRKYKHEEEEHWHEKDWLDEGLRKAYANGKRIPVKIVKPKIKFDGVPDFSPFPLYAQPMPDGATLDQINQHFAIPTPNFRVNTRFMDWAKGGVELLNNNLRNNYITLYG